VAAAADSVEALEHVSLRLVGNRCPFERAAIPDVQRPRTCLAPLLLQTCVPTGLRLDSKVNCSGLRRLVLLVESGILSLSCPSAQFEHRCRRAHINVH
jgi:hypothetical protein